MQSTQLTCPNCGSTLTFGVDIAEGAAVECLICMQTFAASPVAAESLAAEPHERLRSIDAVDAPAFSDTNTGTIPKASTATMPALTPGDTHDGLPSIDAADASGLCDPITNTIPKASEFTDPGASPAETPDGLGSIEAAEPSPPADPIANTMPEPTASVDTPTPVPTKKPASTKTKRASHGEILVAKPRSAPSASAFTEKSAPKPPPPALAKNDKTNPSAAPPLRTPKESVLENKGAIIAVAVGMLFLLTGGIVFAAWTITALTRPRPADVAIDSGEPNTPTPEYSSNGIENGKPIPPPPLTAEQEEELRKKIQQEVKHVLKRKPSAKPGSAELEPDPIASLNLPQQPIVSLAQHRINTAIDKGVAYLKKTQQENGTWNNAKGVGYAAIGGLTLLECNTPAQDPAVQKAAAFVRANTRNLSATYELSLAILFLDRLGDPRDRPLVQGMALRLLAGQKESGGWHYECKPLSSQEMYQLYAFLQSHKPANLLNPLGGSSKTQAGITVNPTRDPNIWKDPFQELNELILTKGIDGTKLDSKLDPKKGGVNPAVATEPKNPPSVNPNPGKAAAKPIHPESFPPNLRNLPIAKHQGLKKGHLKLRHADDDNSNTQFAILALWAARRHDVPTDQALIAAYQRYMLSQNPDGGWGYKPAHASTNAMTNVGLLGLAMGHGAAPDIVKSNPKNPKDLIIKPALQDLTIQKGLKALSGYIGEPSLDAKKTDFPMENLYFLWSVERVAMLYDLTTIGGKDWYRWGAQTLVHNQRPDGDWPSAHYHGSSPPLNTCFALLFLRRSNLVQDLTNNLRLSTAITDPDK